MDTQGGGGVGPEGRERDVWRLGASRPPRPWGPGRGRKGEGQGAQRAKQLPHLSPWGTPFTPIAQLETQIGGTHQRGCTFPKKRASRVAVAKNAPVYLCKLHIARPKCALVLRIFWFDFVLTCAIYRWVARMYIKPCVMLAELLQEASCRLVHNDMGWTCCRRWRGGRIDGRSSTRTSHPLAKKPRPPPWPNRIVDRPLLSNSFYAPYPFRPSLAHRWSFVFSLSWH